jgi:hypothetical protein
MRGSHKMATDKVLITIKGGRVKKGKKNRGWKEGKDIAVTERFLVATQTW